MKPASRDIDRLIAQPDRGMAGMLIFGEDAMRVALKRQELVKNLIGPEGENEMRLTRIPAGDLRKDPALLSDALKAVGFFPGPRVALVEDANEFTSKTILAGLEDWQEGDAQVVVTAGNLKKTSPLRKGFEAAKNALALPIYNNPPTRDAVLAQVKQAGLQNLSRDGEMMILAQAQMLDPGDFAQLVEKIALYVMGQNGPVSVEQIRECIPLSSEAELDDLVNLVANARRDQLMGVFDRIIAQGIQPVGICIAMLRHFRALHTAASDPGGAAQGINRLRPPVFGARRDQMVRQAQSFGLNGLEQVLAQLVETDLRLRSANQTAPQAALVSRCLIRITHFRRQG